MNEVKFTDGMCRMVRNGGISPTPEFGTHAKTKLDSLVAPTY